jgi:hypothetical protein
VVSGTGLGTVASNRYGVHWIYVCPEGEMYILYGKGNYTLTEATSATVITTPNMPYLFTWAKLAAKVIVTGAGVVYSVTQAWSTQFPVSTVPTHNQLSGLDYGSAGHTGFAPTDGWTAISTFVRQPASTSTITLTGDQSAAVKVGMPIKFAHSAVYYYGIVTSVAVSGDTLITIAGAPLVSSSNWIDSDGLFIGQSARVVQEVIGVPGYYNDGVGDNTLLKSDLYMEYVWMRRAAYLVRFAILTDILDSGATQPTLVPVVAGAEVGTGLTFAAADTWVYSGVGMNTANYDIQPGESLEVSVKTSGTNKDARNLSLVAVFVLE